jgi:predicted metal-dependent hydrolase
VRKAIKNLHLGVYPPHGRVRVAAPLRISDDAVRLAVISKLRWIKRQQARFGTQPRQSRREMVSGESHYFLGQRYRLRVSTRAGAGKVLLPNRSTIELYVRPEASAEQRERLLQQWYRRQLKGMIPALLEKWEAALGVRAAEYIIAHELAHLIERRHNGRFIAIMDEHLPQWRLLRAELNSSPLSHETWSY